MKLSTKIKSLVVVASAAVVISGCAPEVEATEAEVNLTTDEELAAYGIGYGFAENLKMQTEGIELSEEALLKGVADAWNASEMGVTQEQIQEAITRLQTKQMEQQAAEAEAASAEVRAAGEAFLTENGAKEGIVTTESGLQYEILTRGDSETRPTAENTVKVHYHGTLIDGTVFDSSVDRGEPIEFPLGGVIAGWTEGVQLMAEGDKFRFFIPADLAYGDSQASPLIPAGSTLIFEVELLEVL